MSQVIAALLGGAFREQTESQLVYCQAPCDKESHSAKISFKM